jgi:3-dehydroquinate dehydratase
MLTMPRTRTHGAIAYGLGRIIDNTNLPGTTQAAIINASTYTPMSAAAADAVVPEDLPTFVGMETFRW